MASPVAEAKAKHISNGFTEVYKRTKGGIESRIPGTNRRAMSVFVGNNCCHFGDGPFDESHEIDTAWVASGGAWDWEMLKADYHAFIRDSVPVSYRYEDAATGHFVELTITSIQWVNDEGASENITNFFQVTPVTLDDQITWSSIAPGWDVRVNALPTKLAKWIDIDSLSNLGAPTIGGSNIQMRLQLTWQRSQGLEIWVDGSQWDEKNNTWVDTPGYIEFRDETTQEIIYSFAAPFGFDDTQDNITPMSQRVRRLGANFYSEIFTPWVWLQAAQYPIHLDTTIDVETGASNEDGVESSGTTSISGATPTLDHTTVDHMGFYFTLTSDINSGDTFNTSHIVCHTVNKDDPDLDITADDQDTPSVFTTAGNPNNDISGRTDTTASVQWTATGLGNNADHNSPSIISIIDELATSGYLDDSGPLVLIFTSRSSSCNFRINHYDAGSFYPNLYIDFTAASGLSVTLDTAALSVTGVPLSINAPITRVLDTATISVTGVQALINAPVTVGLNSAALSVTGIPSSIVPGEATISLSSAALSLAGIPISIDAPVTIGLNSATISINGVNLTVSAPPPGLQIGLSTAALSLAGVASSIVPGEVSIPLSSATINVNGVNITISAAGAPQSITLDTAALSLSGIPLKIWQTIKLNSGAINLNGIPIKIGQGIPLGTATININGVPITISAPVSGLSVLLDTAALSLTGINSSIIPGAVSIPLSSATISLGGIPITINTGGAPQTIVLSSAALSVTGVPLSIDALISILLSTASININGVNSSIVPGAVSTLLDTASISLNGVSMTPAALIAVLQALTLYNRSGSLTLENRDLDLELFERVTGFTLEDK